MSSQASSANTTPIVPYTSEERATRCGTAYAPTTFRASSPTAPSSAAGSRARTGTRRLGRIHDVHANNATSVATDTTTTSGAKTAGSTLHAAVATLPAAIATPAPTIHAAPK